MNRLTETLDYALFYPQTHRDLRKVFKELEDAEEFKPLTEKEMLLCWFMANKTSPFYYFVHINRIQRSIEHSGYTGDEAADKFTIKDLRNNKLPHYFKKALEKMSTYEPDVRKKMASVLLKIVEHAENSVNIDLEIYKTDASKLKAFNDMCMSIGEKLPGLLKSVESMFGIVDFDRSSADSSKIDIFN